MPDIVLKDSNGNAQTFTGATGLGVDTVEGGVAVFVSRDLIPEAYTHPATHPASMITDLSKVATGGRFADLLQKPFYDLPRLDSTELTFTKDYDDLACCFCEIPGTWEVPLGETYKVTWDGQEYTCTCKDVSEIGEVNISGISYLGNSAKLFGMGWGTDTGEPFIIGFNTQLDSGEYGNATIMTTDMSESHTVSIIPVNSVKKLDAKYLPDTAATKQWVREFAEEALADLDISGGSGGAAVTETEILPEQEFVFTSDDSSNVDSIFVHAVMGESELLTKLLNIKVGKHYTVVLDGVEYNCTALDTTVMGGVPADTTVNGVALLGNVSLADVSGAEDTGEPFWIQAIDIVELNDDGTSTASKVAAILIKPGIAAESVTCTVRIYQKADLTVSWDNVTDKPFGEETRSSHCDFSTLPTITFDALGYTWWKVSELTPSKEQLLKTVFNMVDASGGLHNQTPVESEIAIQTDDILQFQFASGMTAGFVIAYTSGSVTLEISGNQVTVDIPETGMYFAYHMGLTPSAEFVIDVYYEEINQIDQKYIPSPPEFDLTEMGLPTITLGGAQVSAKCDTTELRAALNKGAVKVKLVVNAGQNITADMLVSPFCAMGSYQINGLGYFENPVFVAIIVQDNYLAGSAIPLSTAAS